MAAEDQDGGRSPSANPTRASHSLDDLAKGLTGGAVHPASLREED
jgi:hypothetical protein